MTSQILLETETDSTVLRKPGPVELDRAKFAKKRKIIDNILRWGTPILILIVWQIFTVSGILDRKFWPAPTDIAVQLWKTIASGFLPENLWVTFKRLIIGFAFGSVIGIAMGLVLGTVRPIRISLEPIVSAVYTIPKLAIFPLLLMLFGIGDTPKIILTALGAFFITCISTLAAVLAVAPEMYEPMRSFGATQMQTFRHLTFPAILPEIFVALRLGSGMAFIVLVGMEMIQGASGLGYVIWSSWQVFDTQRMYVGIVVASVFGVAFQMAIKGVGRLAIPWQR